MVKARRQDQQLEGILQRIHDARSFDFRNYKRPTLQRRVERRMQARRCKTMADYGALLDRDPAEFDALISSMLIKVTSFFRDPEMWDELSKKLIPQMLAEKRSGQEIRVWCAGCATGEEAFSVAILLAEAMGPAFQNQDVKIFGTDLDEKAIAFARHGVYSREQVQSVSPARLKEYFVEDAEGFTLKKEIRRAVVFGVNNLVSDAPISRLDILVCRNVFIYLDAPLQKRVLTRFHYALRPRGILVLGKSELSPFARKVFESVDLARRIYRKDGGRSAMVAQERLISLLEQDSAPRGGNGGEAPGADDTVEQFHHDVIHSLKNPLIVTSADGTIMLWNAAAAALWGRSEIEVTGKKLAGLALPGLAGDLLLEKTAQVREGRSDFEMVTGVMQRPGDGRPVQLAVELTPLRETNARQVTGLVYSARDVTAVQQMEAELRTANEERRNAYEELQTMNEELQSSNEELETTNEELQSANEELQTTNEELQSTNEELETTNEELHSTNAELDATNRELAHRTGELNALAFVQRSIIRTIGGAVVVLDPSGRIKLWNLAAERLLGIAEDEAVGQLLWTLNIPALGRAVLQRIRKAVQQGSPFRAEVQYELPTGADGRASVVAVPIVDDSVALGSVIIFEDVTRMAALAAELAALRTKNGDRTQPKRNG